MPRRNEPPRWQNPPQHILYKLPSIPDSLYINMCCLERKQRNKIVLLFHSHWLLINTSVSYKKEIHKKMQKKPSYLLTCKTFGKDIVQIGVIRVGGWITKFDFSKRFGNNLSMRGSPRWGRHSIFVRIAIPWYVCSRTIIFILPYQSKVIAKRMKLCNYVGYDPACIETDEWTLQLIETTARISVISGGGGKAGLYISKVDGRVPTRGSDTEDI